MIRMNKKSFPAMPSYKGEWVPIYMEPVIGCGERITIAVSAIGANGDFKVIQAIRPEVLRCIYGARAKDVQSQVDWVLSSLTEYVSKNLSCKGWAAPFSGIEAGSHNDAASDDIEGILKQAIRFSASLSNLALTADRDEESINPVKDTFYKKVKENVLYINPELKNFFNHSVKLSNTEKTTKFGYIAHNYAANFSAIRINSPNTDRIAKSRVLDLEALRVKQAHFPQDNFELILGVPPSNDVTVPEAAIKRLDERVKDLIQIADEQNIRVCPVTEIDEAVSRVMKMSSF